MASLAPYAITLGVTDYPVKYAGLLSYIEPYLTNLETFSFSGGNVSLGVTPSAWNSSWKVFGASRDATFGGTDGGAVYGFMAVNAYADGSAAPGAATWRYKLTGSLASKYEQTSGEHRFFTAPSGTAGNAISFTQAMTLDASGNLGVGTTSPQAKLNVADATSATIRITSTGGNANLDLTCSTTTATVGSPNGVPLLFTTSNTERMRLDANGNLGLGVTPSAWGSNYKAFESAGNSSVALAAANINGINIVSNAYADNTAWYYKTTGAASRYSINSNVHQWYTAPSGTAGNAISFTQAMMLTGGGEVYIAGTADQGAYNLQVNGTGVWGAGAYVNGSDKRLKDNIQTLNDGLSVVSQLRPVTFQYKPEHSKDQSVQPGFIAQELQQVMAGKDYLDGVVQSGPKYLNVAYQNLIPILTKAIQEQQAIINDLRARVAALEAQP